MTLQHDRFRDRRTWMFGICQDDVDGLLTEWDALRAENEQLRSDALRYQFIREASRRGELEYTVALNRWDFMSADRLDAEIDELLGRE